MRRWRRALSLTLNATLLLTGQGLSFYEASAAVITSVKTTGAPVSIRVVPAQLGSGGVSFTGSHLTFQTSLTPLTSPTPSVTPTVGAQTVQAQNVVSPTVTPLLAPALVVPAAKSFSANSPLAKTPAAVVAAQADSFGQGLTTAKDHGQSQAPVLQAFFDGKTVAPQLDPSGAVVFLVREGQPTLTIPLSQLSTLLAEHPEAAAALKAKGRVVVVTEKEAAEGRLTKADVPAVKALMESLGLGHKVNQETLVIAKAKAPEAQDGTAKKPAIRAGFFLRPFRELAFLGRTAAASYSTPLWSEVIGGLVTKGFPLVVSVATYWKVIGPAHPYLLGAAIAASLFLEVFHGIFLNTWNTFQDNLKKLRGLSYQVFFTLVYMQGWGALFRGLSWGANHKQGLISPPWSLAYWKDILIMSVLGTFFGTLGINGLNSLYAKGRINRWQRSAIQQIRDLLFLLAGPLFASGSMTAFWSVFIFQQLLDLGVFMAGWKATARPMLYVAASGTAQAPEFKAKFPVDGLPAGNPLKEAWNGIKGNPIVRVAAWPFKMLGKLFRKKGTSQ